MLYAINDLRRNLVDIEVTGKTDERLRDCFAQGHCFYSSQIKLQNPAQSFLTA
jgi:hypothetical protein